MKINEFVLNCVNFEKVRFVVRVKYINVVFTIDNVTELTESTNCEIDMFYTEFNSDGSITYVLLINPSEFNLYGKFGKKTQNI